jgi:DNA-cytosine methyltransferase
MGLERAGFRIVSHSEIEPHACAVLARHWPDVPNLGDISALRLPLPHGHGQPDRADGRHNELPDGASLTASRGLWTRADVWAGGPPCQGFSIAGQRRGLDDHRSSLAVTWLDLVGRYRPGALLFENVPGILSSADGLDWYALLRTLGELGYWWAYRVLDAQWFGVPQRRRRVFLVALDAGRYPDPDGPGQVLAVGTRCSRDHAQEREAWAAAAGRAGRGAGIVEQAVTAKWSKQSSGPAGDEHHHLIAAPVHPSIRAGGHGDPGIGRDNDHDRLVVVDRQTHHPGGGGAPDGLAGRTHDRAETRLVMPALLSSMGNGVSPGHGKDEHVVLTTGTADDPLLPIGQDSKRYRTIGNGVATPCAEWIGHRLMAYLSAARELDQAA